MAEESNLPEQNQSPVFKAGEAFNREEINKKIMMDPTGVDTEELKKVKSGEEVTKEAKNFFRENYKKSLEELDPDSAKTPWYYEFAYSPTTSFYRQIARTIESGEALDGAKDIIPMAKEAAGQKVTNAKALKAGTVTEIIDLIGTKEIEEKEGFASARDEFNSKVKDEKNSFENLYKAFRENIDLFNRDLSTIDERTRSKIFSPENNAIISALAKALKEEGIENESVNAMAERFEENIGKLLEKIPGQKIEAAKEEAPKKVESQEKPEVSKSEEKLEEKMEEKKTEGGTPAAPASTPIETPKATETAPVTQEAASPAAPGTPETKTGESKLVTPEVAPPTTKTQEQATPITGTTKTGVSEEAKKSAEGAIESIFGGMGAGKTEGSEGGAASAASSSPALSRYSEMLESLFGPGVSSMIPGLGGMGGEGEASEITGETTKITEKISQKGETISPGGGIKETGVQKLASPLPTSSPKPATPASPETPVSTGAKSQEQPNEASPVEEAMAITEESKAQGGQPQTPSTEGGGDFSEKLNQMVNLLSQLNDTLQNPLIVTPTTKNF